MYIFQIAMEIGEKLVLFILQLMGAIIPTYLLAVGITSQATALGFNSLIMTLIAVIEDVILNFLCLKYIWQYPWLIQFQKKIFCQVWQI